MAFIQEFKHQQIREAAQILAAALVDRWFETPPPVAALAASAADDPPQKLLSRKEAARAFSVSVATIDRLRRAGDLKPVKITDKVRRYDAIDLERLIRRRK